MDEHDLRDLATELRTVLPSLIVDQAEWARIDAELERALAMPAGSAKQALLAVTMAHPATRAWVRNRALPPEAVWRGDPGFG
jgi:hypothetical protein